MYAIQSLKSKRYFNTKDSKAILHPDASPEWTINKYLPFKSEDDAGQAIRRFNLKEVEIVPLYNETPDYKVSRVDRNIEFISIINQQAARFKMKTVGIPSIDKLINKDLGFAPRVLAKQAAIHNLLCCINHKWYDIQYEVIERKAVLINKCVLRDIKEPMKFQEVGYLFGNRLTIRQYGNKKNIIREYESLEEVEEQIEDNKLSSFRREYNKPIKLICRIHNAWYYMYYVMDEPGHVVIQGYEKAVENRAFNEELNKLNLAKIDPKLVNVLIIIDWGGIIKNRFKVVNVHGIIK